MRDGRWFSGEEITTLVASPLSCANDGDDDEDEENEEEEKKKGDEDEEEEEEPLWTAPNDHRQVTVGRPTSLYQSAVCGESGVNLAFMVTQVIGRRYSAVIGFENDGDAKKATPLLKKAVPQKQKKV